MLGNKIKLEGKHSHAEMDASFRAGLDLEMPGPARHMGERLLPALMDTDSDARRLDDAAVRLARLAERRRLLGEAALNAGWRFGTHDTAAPPAQALLWLWSVLEG